MKRCQMDAPSMHVLADAAAVLHASTPANGVLERSPHKVCASCDMASGRCMEHVVNWMEQQVPVASQETATTMHPARWLLEQSRLHVTSAVDMFYWLSCSMPACVQRKHINNMAQPAGLLLAHQRQN
jgi:hypothetical protein